MSRVQPLVYSELAPDTQRIYKSIAGQRGGTVDGPFRVWLRANPELASRMNDVGDTLRMKGTLDKKLFELAVLSVARFWDCNYQWSAHVPLALQVGLSREAVEDIGNRRRPNSMPDDQLLTYELAVTLLSQHAIPRAIYEAAIQLFGFEEMVELVTTIGQYSMAAIVLNAFAIEPLVGSDLLPR
jgi:4-carboxymuconolactone decarboxylase